MRKRGGTPGNMMKPRPNVLKRNMELAEALAKENGGNLPNPWSLIQMGHAGLYRYILRHPTHFRRFTFDSAVGREGGREKTTFNLGIRQTHLETAASLAKQNRGKLPPIRTLSQRGFTKLLSYMRTYPDLFAQWSPENLNGNGEAKMKAKSEIKKRRRKVLV